MRSVAIDRGGNLDDVGVREAREGPIVADVDDLDVAATVASEAMSCAAASL